MIDANKHILNDPLHDPLAHEDIKLEEKSHLF